MKLSDDEVRCNNKSCKFKDDCERFLQRKGAARMAIIIPARNYCDWQIKKEGAE